MESVRWALAEIGRGGHVERDGESGWDNLDRFKASVLVPEKSMYLKNEAVESYMRYKKQQKRKKLRNTIDMLSDGGKGLANWVQSFETI